MFNIKTITALAAAGMLFTACEQDQGITPDNLMTTSGKTSNGNGDKSSNIIPGLQEFVDDLVKNNDTPDDMPLEDAVLFTESALNVQLANTAGDLVTTDSLYIVSSTLNTNATAESGLVLGTEIYDFYNNIKTQIMTIGNNNFSSGDVQVASVDISYGEHFDKSAVKVLIKFGRGGVPAICDWNGDYKAALRQGGCGTNPGQKQNTDAAKEVSMRIQNGNCNSPLERCGFVFNLTSYPDPIASGASYWNTELYNVSPMGNVACISELAQAQWYNRMENYINANYPYINAKGRQVDVINSWLQQKFRFIQLGQGLNRTDVYVNNLIQFTDCTFINDVGIDKPIF